MSLTGVITSQTIQAHDVFQSKKLAVFLPHGPFRVLDMESSRQGPELSAGLILEVNSPLPMGKPKWGFTGLQKG